MFDLFKRTPSPEELMRQAKAIYEKTAALTGDTSETRSLRSRIALLCRAHMDKTFISGAEKTAIYQDVVALSLASGEKLPEAPMASNFQKIMAGSGEIYVYMPTEYSEQAFNLGMRYQKTDITPQQAIEAMQRLADMFCRYELGMDEPFQVMQFLREELEEEARLNAQANSNDPSEGAEGSEILSR